MPRRNDLLDKIKAFAVILVAVGHGIVYTNPGFDNDLVFRLIAVVNMPLFMFVSGNVAFMSYKGEVFKTIWKRFKSLIIPFISWYIAAEYFLIGRFREYSFYDFMIRLAKSPDNGLWFLWILFFCYVEFTIIDFLVQLITKRFRISQIVVEIPVYTLVSLLQHKYIISWFGVYLLAWYFPFFILGYLVWKYRDKIKPVFPYVAEASFIAFPFLFYFWHRINNPFGLVGYESTVYRYLTALSGIVICYIMIKQVAKPKKIGNFLMWLGNYTLEIYAMNSLVIKYFLIQSSTLVFLGYPFIAAFSIIIALAISLFFIRQSRILKFFLLGQ